MNKNERNKLSCKGIIYLIVGSLCILIAPTILTLPACASIFDFSESGQIGDTIGGITAPIVSILGSILVFWALKAQIDANNIVQSQIKEQWDRENLNLLCDRLIKSIDGFSIEYEDNSKKTGSEAIYDMLHELYCASGHSKDDIDANPTTAELISILEICKAAKTTLDNSKITDKSAFELVIIHQFKYRIYPRVKKEGEAKSFTEHYCEEHQAYHGLCDEMAFLFEELEEKLIIKKGEAENP